MIEYMLCRPTIEGSREVKKCYKRMRRGIIFREWVRIAYIDAPGTWNEDSWNLHYDGCDYEHKSLCGCLKRLKEYDAYTLNVVDGEYYKDIARIILAR